eukprot:Skav231169  [mRNA]  locus=scaffold3252:297026:301749:- [translate_table: standard]
MVDGFDKADTDRDSLLTVNEAPAPWRGTVSCWWNGMTMRKAREHVNFVLTGTGADVDGNVGVTTAGGNMLAAGTSAARCGETSYFPSALESRFRRDRLNLTENVDALCNALRNASDKWIGMNLEAQPPPMETLEIFSKMCPSGANEQIMEPLAGILRDPRMFCPNTSRTLLHSVDWLVLADNNSFPSSSDSKRILCDAGGSNFWDATKFFITKYAERGLEFDQIFVWEYNVREYGTYWNLTPSEFRQKWEPRLTWYNGASDCLRQMGFTLLRAELQEMLELIGAEKAASASCEQG